MPGVARSNRDAEVAFVGALLLDAVKIGEVRQMIRVEDIHNSKAQKIYAALLELDEAGSPVDFVTVAEVLRGRGELEAAGGVEAMVHASETVTSSAHVNYHGRMIRDAAVARSIVELCGSASQELVTAPLGHDAMEAAVSDLASELLRLGDRFQENEHHEGVREALARAMIEMERGELSGGLKTGLQDLDELIMGLSGGHLHVIGARPSVGKTGFMLQVMANVARPRELDGEGAHCLFFSGEMPNRSLALRLVCARSLVPSHRIYSRKMDMVERERIQTAAREIERFPIHLSDLGGSFTMSRIRAQSLAAKKAGQLDLILIDYLQLVRPPRSLESASIREQVNHTSRSVKALARELDVPVVIGCQLNRDAEKADEPGLHHLKESGRIEEDADTVTLMWATDEDKSSNVLRAKVAKHRDGPTGKLKLFADRPCFHFANHSPLTEVIDL